MQSADILIHAHWIAPVRPQNCLLEQHSLAISGGKIIAIVPPEERSNWVASTTYELNDHIVTPGFVNAHTHAAMNLLRGLADDLSLMNWLHEHIWPAEAAHVNEQFIADGVKLAAAEMLRYGTTCFNDMYFFPDVAAKTASELGIRAVVGLIMLDFPTQWASGPDEYLSKGIAVHDAFRSDPLITTALAPHAPYTVSDAPLKRLAAMAPELDVPIHMHIHETAQELADAVEQTEMRPLERLNQLGLLGPGLLAVHMTQLTDDEIALVAESGTHVVHCPESNMKLASGQAPVAKLLAAGVNVALGTDGAASNNDLDMIGEMHSAALLGKVTAQDAQALPAHQVLEMATLAGAKALGLEQTIGSLEVGKAADITAINLSDLSSQPVFDPVSHLVNCVTRSQVSHVWVNGQLKTENGQLTDIDQASIIEAARQWRDRIAANNLSTHD